MIIEAQAEAAAQSVQRQKRISMLHTAIRDKETVNNNTFQEEPKTTPPLPPPQKKEIPKQKTK